MKYLLLLFSSDSVIINDLNLSVSDSFSIWFWIAIIELIIIVFLILKLNKKQKPLAFSNVSKEKLKQDMKKGVDMDNLMHSIVGAKELYKELSKKCHPDRFVNSDKQPNAEEIFQEITDSKRNFKKLEELKIRAIKDLEIDF